MMRHILNHVLRGYQLVISPYLGVHCRYHPTCSDYCRQSIVIHGVWRGLLLGVGRILRCHPWHAGGLDPVPQPKQNDV